MSADLQATIEAAFAARDTISTSTQGEVREAVNGALNMLDNGEARVAEPG
ncbi:MAG: 2,3,4,5-tetrahydropyridine-2,6-dicarboxylate N-succinyltransferase, partial [Pseudomonadota bacterium]